MASLRPTPVALSLLATLAQLASAAPAAEPRSPASPSFDPWTQSARYRFTYRVDLAQIAAEPGDRVQLWLPAPAETPDQRVLERVVVAPIESALRSDALGNQIVSLAWQGPARAGDAVELTAVVERRVAHGMPARDAVAGSPDDPKRHLAPTKRIPLDGVIEQIAAQESRGQPDDGAKIRAFYDYVVRTMRYSKEGQGWGQGDAIWACTEKYGNCTDFHSLFLGLARSQGIPARFEIGFPIPADQSEAEIPGYHCWAEAFDPARGWVPFDASEAWKAKRFDAYFGTLPSDRIAFTTGRDLVLEPAQQGPPLNYFIYPYAERNGAPVDGVKGVYRFERVAAPVALR